MNDFPIVINGADTSGDYLSIYTTNYKNSPYTVNVTLTVNRPDKVSIM